MRQPLTLYFTMVHSPDGVKRAGPARRIRENAVDWTPFVRKFWNCRVTVRACKVTFDEDGQPDEASRRRLLEEFNIDVRSKTLDSAPSPA